LNSVTTSGDRRFSPSTLELAAAAAFKVRDVLEGGRRVRILPHAREGARDVARDLGARLLVGGGDAVERHAVLLDGRRELAGRVVHVPGVHAHARGVLWERVLSAVAAGRGLADLLVRLERLGARARAEQPVGQVERRREGEVGVLLLVQTRLVARFRQALLLLDARARELQRAPRVARDAQPRGLLQQRMHLGLHLAAPLVGAVIRATRQSRRRGLRAAARAPGAVSPPPSWTPCPAARPRPPSRT
jgi:hypothetical protein